MCTNVVVVSKGLRNPSIEIIHGSSVFGKIDIDEALKGIYDSATSWWNLKSIHRQRPYT